MSINTASFDDDSITCEVPIRNISRVAGLIKQRLDIVKAAIAYGFDYSRKEANHPCPACSKTSKSRATLHLYDDRWHCFSCAVGGDVIDYIAHAEGLAKGKAIANLAARLGITDDSDGDVIDDAIDRFRTIIEDRKQASYDPPIMQTIDRAWDKIVRDREECQMRPEPAKMAGMFHRLDYVVSAMNNDGALQADELTLVIAIELDGLLRVHDAHQWLARRGAGWADG